MNSTVNHAEGPLVTTRIVDHESAPMAVVEAVAAVAGASPTELTPLADAVDTDALQSLVERGDDTLELTFRYDGYRVVVTTATVAVY